MDAPFSMPFYLSEFSFFIPLQSDLWALRFYSEFHLSQYTNMYKVILLIKNKQDLKKEKYQTYKILVNLPKLLVFSKQKKKKLLIKVMEI